MANGTSESDKMFTDGPGNGQQDPEPEEMEQDMNAENVEEEYAALEETLNQLDSCLDDLEEKNDSLNAKLKDLLESTKETAAEVANEGGDKDQKDSAKGSSGATH